MPVERFAKIVGLGVERVDQVVHEIEFILDFLNGGMWRKVGGHLVG